MQLQLIHKVEGMVDAGRSIKIRAKESGLSSSREESWIQDKLGKPVMLLRHHPVSALDSCAPQITAISSLAAQACPVDTSGTRALHS